MNNDTFNNINHKIKHIKAHEYKQLRNIFNSSDDDNNITKQIKYFFKNKQQKHMILFINGKFGCNKTKFSSYFVKKLSSNRIIIDFYDIIKSYCLKYNMPINNALFLFFTFDSKSPSFKKLNNSFIDYFYQYILNISLQYKIIIIKGYIFNKHIFLKINYLFDIYNIYLIKNDEKQHFFDIVKKIYFDYKTSSQSINIHSFFFGKFNINQPNTLLKFILTNKYNHDNLYYIIENYIRSPFANEHLFYSFYKNNFNKHNSIVFV
jgi:hypothetical protein